MPEAMPNDAEAIEPLMLARQFMQRALAYLDDYQAPADIGAHLDQALVRLDQVISESAS